MSKFVRVHSAPEELEKGCIVIGAPSFIEEIKACSKKKPKNGVMTHHYIREILGTIGLKYADNTFDVLTQVNVSRLRGVPFETVSDVDVILNGVIKKQCPRLYEDYMNFYIKKRPFGTRLIYFLGSPMQTATFTENGIDELKLKDVDVYLGKRQKKVVGKPAITNEEAGIANLNK